ncbi:hypothetical protein [Mycolicibacterium palauense]|uniref:hypothetical protein n=1 Tax=Mycolicibacterium palauense TaxID=2034511 RepID=UPI001145A048|nr:hypothetical protein [Mycolicibacterium palauense]
MATAMSLKVNMLAIRKTGTQSHSNGLGEGRLGLQWVFFDDFISSGATFVEVHKAVSAIAKRNKFKTECVGAFLYEAKPRNRFKTIEDLRHGYCRIGNYLSDLEKAQTKKWTVAA